MITLLRYGLPVAAIVLWLWCVADVFTADARRIGRVPKLAWIFAVLLLPVVGPAAWVLIGRPGAKPRPPRARPSVAPDDDPRFLADLADEIRRRRERPPEPPAPDASSP